MTSQLFQFDRFGVDTYPFSETLMIRALKLSAIGLEKRETYRHILPKWANRHSRISPRTNCQCSRNLYRAGKYGNCRKGSRHCRRF